MMKLIVICMAAQSAAGTEPRPNDAARKIAAKIEGTVLDPAGAPAPGASVEIEGPSGDLVASAVTLEDGRFEVEVASGTYAVTVALAGFSVFRRDVVAGETPPLQVVLHPAPWREQVSVTATRNEEAVDRAPQPVSIVDRGEIEMRQPLNPTEILASLPGVHFAESGPFRPRPILRGLDSNRLLVLVDGQRLNNSRTSTSNSGIEPGLVDVEQIERIEVVRGAGSVLHGSDAMAGVINIITRAPERPAEAVFTGSLAGEYHGVRDGGRIGAAAGVGASRWALRVGGSFGRYDDYRSAEHVVPNSGAEERNLEATLSLWPSERDLLRIQWSGRDGRDIGVPGTTLATGFFALFPYDDRDKLAAFYRREDAGSSLGEVQAHGYWQRQNRNFENLVAAPGFSLESSTETDTRSVGFDVQLARLLGDDHRITYGAAVFSDANQDVREQTMFPGTPFERPLGGAPSVPDARLTGLGLFLQDEWAVHERAHLNLGLRGDLFHTEAEADRGFEGPIGDPRTNSTSTGTAGLVVDAFPGGSLYGRVSRAFREPNLFERYFFGRGSVAGFVVPNPELRPETAIDVEAGLRLSTRPMRLDLGYFHNRLRDLIASVPGTWNGSPTLGGQPVFTNTNVERARIQGVEASLELAFQAKRQSFLVYSRNSYLRGTNLTSSTPLPLIAPYLTTTGIRWIAAEGKWIQDLELQAAAGSDRVPQGARRLEGFAVLHLRGQVSLFERDGFFSERRGLPSRLSWGIENATDRAYELLFSGIPAEGVDFKLGLRWEL
ncbi:MAG: TonB-dependent receptor [Vicinamibacteria bacterium]